MSGLADLRRRLAGLAHVVSSDEARAVVHRVTGAPPMRDVERLLAAVGHPSGAAAGCLICQTALHLLVNEALRLIAEAVADAIVAGEIGVESAVDAVVVGTEVAGDVVVDGALAVSGVGAVADIAAAPAELVAEVIGDEVLLNAEGVINLVTRTAITSAMGRLDRTIENAHVVQLVIEDLCRRLRACPSATS
jgi:hypothetical protein